MSTIDELFAEVYANPDDDPLKRVLSDALMARGDPRGELILFQLEPDKDYHRRAMRLIQAHGLSWLGALRGAVIPLLYERGFLSSAALLAGTPIDFDEPMWGTVHTIDLDAFDERNIASVRLTPAMRSLQTLVNVNELQVAILRDRHDLERLRIVPRPDAPASVPDYYDPADE